MVVANPMNPGGRTQLEQAGYDAWQRLHKDHEHHNVVTLPCCGTQIEVADFRSDRYVQCPNKKCLKRHVILSGTSQKIRSLVDDVQPRTTLIW